LPLVPIATRAVATKNQASGKLTVKRNLVNMKRKFTRLRYPCVAKAHGHFL
jgi:hypothetical protein